MRFVLRSLLLLIAPVLLHAPLHAQAGIFPNPPVIPTVNGWPAAIYAADVNNDGFPDLIYIEHGAQPNQPSTTHVLLNDGHANFTASAVIQTVGNSLAIGNLSGNGHVDIGWIAQTSVAGTFSQINLTVAAGDGTGRFSTFQVTPGISSGTPFKFVNLLAGKLHDAGALDVLAQDANSNTLYDFQTNTIHTLATSTFVNLPDGPGPMQVQDLNSDGHNDVIVNGLTTSAIDVYLGTALGLNTTSFSTPPNFRFAPTAGVRSLLLADLKNDSRPDLITEAANGNLAVYAGNGDGTFASTPFIASGTTASPQGASVGVGGHLIAVNPLSPLSGTTALQILTATPIGISNILAGSPAFFLNGIFNAGPGRTSYAVADFNNDSILDLAIDSPEGIALLFGTNGDGQLSTSATNSSVKSYAAGAGQPALSVALAHISSQTYLDAVVSTAATQALVFPHDGSSIGRLMPYDTPFNPTYTTTQSGIPNLWSTVQTADINGDGITDLIFTADGANANLPANGSGTGLAVQFGQGKGTFSDPQPITVANQFTTPPPSSCSPPFDHYPGMFFGTSTIADITRDGIPDIVSRDATAYRVLKGNAGPYTNIPQSLPTLFWSGVDGVNTTVECGAHAHDRVLTADFNGDGYPDILFQHNGDLLLYLTDANAVPEPSGNLAIDGNLTTSGQLTAPALAPNFGGISPTFGAPYFIGSMAAADLDRDGNQDLLVLYHNLSADPTAPSAATPNYLYIWFGSGNGKFLTSAKHPVNPVRIQLSRNYYQVALTDLNSDGIADLILSDGYLLSLQYGLGDGTFGPEVHLLAGQGINGIAAGGIRSSLTHDLVVANGGLTLSNPVVNHETLTPNPGANTGGITYFLNNYQTPVVTASPEPQPYGTPITLTATLANAASFPGTFTFSIDGTAIGTVTSSTGSATLYFSPNPLTVGTHTLQAAFTTSNGVAFSTATGTHTVVLDPTSVTLTPTTPLTTYYGQPADGTFLVSVPPGAPDANGNYTLQDNGVDTAICTNIPLHTTCPYGNPVFLDPGSHTFVIHYLGDQYTAPSFSNPVTYIILADTTTATLTSSLNPAVVGTPVTFTAVITGNITAPTGTVNFFDGLTQIGTGTLTPTGTSTAAAAFTTSTLTVGSHVINAAYPGNVDFNPVITAPITQVITPVIVPVGPGSFTFTVSPNPVTIGAGRTANLTVTIKAIGSFAQPVQLTCANLPAETACMFFNAGLVPAGSAPVTVGLTTSAPHDCNDPTHPYFLGTTLTLFLLGLGTRSRFRKLSLLLILTAAGLTLSATLSGCGHCTDLGNRPGTYSFTLTATAQGTPITQSSTQTIPFTVTIP